VSRKRKTAFWAKSVAGMASAAAAWWLVKRVWLVKEGTEAEPPAAPATPEPLRREPSPVDPVDEAIDESFPASDPPSYAGARGQGEIRP
jgi:hypothetical protein